MRGLVEEPPRGEAPAALALACLDKAPELGVLEPAQVSAGLERLDAALGEDPTWRHWLAELRERLDALARLQRERPRVLWRERGELLALGTLLHDATERRFSLATGHGLPVLWLPVVAERWEQRIEAALATLEGEEPGPYLDVALSGFEHWTDPRNLTLEFVARNRYHADVLLQGLDLPGRGSIGPLPVVRAAPEGLAPGAHVRVGLTTETPNQVAGTVTLHCLDLRLNRSFAVSAPFATRRDLVRFFPGEWQPTGERLQGLLDRQDDFHWLDGYYWTRSERVDLTNQVQQIFGRDLKPQTLNGLAQAPDDGVPILAPDLLLNPSDPARLVDSLNWTLHDPQSRVAARLSLAIWRRIHPFPPAVAAALGDLLPKPDRVADLLLRLFGTAQRVAALDRGLAALPPGALGAWCTGDPVYATLLGRGDLTEREALAMYPDPLGVFDAEVWVALAGLPDQALADWLGRPVAALRHPAVLGLFGALPAAPPARDAAARRLLEPLGADPIEAPLPGRVWRLLTPLWLLEQRYSRCHLLLGDLGPAEREGLNPSAEDLWLHIGPRRPSGLVGRVLSLDLGAAMRLAHLPRAVDLPADAAGRNPAVAELDRLLALLEPPRPERLFQTANGIGPPEQVPRRFFGRERERRILLDLLDAADRSPTRAEAVLLVAGRRMGKTSLRQWLEAEIGRAERPRACITLDCQNTPLHKHRDDLLRWFYQAIKDTVNDWWRARGHGEPLLTQGWLHPAKPEQRDAALLAFETAWRGLRAQSGQAPLLILDETRDLVAADTGLSLWGRLKGWVDTGLFALLATAFPQGQGERRTLSLLHQDPSTPLYNSFRQVLPIGPWGPDETWDFLAMRLGQLGVLLPRHFRPRALRLTRGIPWLAQTLGEQLCLALGQQERVVSREAWLRAQDRVLNGTATMLREAVEAAARANDENAHWGRAGPLPERLRLQDGPLWRALCACARPGSANCSPLDGGRWAAPRELHTRDLRATLGTDIGDERLRQALRDLIDPGLLLGDTADRDRFTFVADLLPCWLTWSDNHG